MSEHLDLDAADTLAAEMRDAIAPGAPIMRVARTRALPPANSFVNVAQVVADEGGAAQYGWLFTIWPGRFVEAIFHAVWRGPAGVQDITDHPMPGCTAATTTFLSEPRFAAPADVRLIAVPPNFLLLDDSVLTRRYCAASVRFVVIQQELFALVEAGRAGLVESGYPGRVGLAALDHAARGRIRALGAEQQEVLDQKARLMRDMRRGRDAIEREVVPIRMPVAPAMKAPLLRWGLLGRMSRLGA